MALIPKIFFQGFCSGFFICLAICGIVARAIDGVNIGFSPVFPLVIGMLFFVLGFNNYERLTCAQSKDASHE